MNPVPHLNKSSTMDTLIEDMLRQRKLLLWRKIVATFPIKKHHQDRIMKRIFPQSLTDLSDYSAQHKGDTLPDDMPTAPHCSEIDK